MNLRIGSILVLAAFATTLAYYIGTRMSSEAVNMAVGVLCGIVASVPVSLGLLVALTRQRQSAYDDEPAPNPAQALSGYPRPSVPQAPQIIVVAPPQRQYQPGQNVYGYPFPGAAQYTDYTPSQHEDVIEGRDWRIIGDDEG